MRHEVDGPATAEPTSTRRRFLAALAAGGAVVTIAGAAVPLSELWAPAYADVAADKGMAQFLESVELAATEGYAAAAKTGKLTTPAVLQSAELFASHHRAHAAAYGSYAGDAAKAVPNPKLVASLTPLVQAATDEMGLVKVLYGLENALAATHLAAIAAFLDPIALKAGASILPVESEHAAVLGHVLGETFDDRGTFVPAFLSTDAAVMPAQYPISPGT